MTKTDLSNSHFIISFQAASHASHEIDLLSDVACPSVMGTRMSLAKTEEPIEMPFKWYRLVLDGLMKVHIGATWRVRLNDPCAATMRPYVDLL